MKCTDDLNDLILDLSLAVTCTQRPVHFIHIFLSMLNADMWTNVFPYCVPSFDISPDSILPGNV